MVVLFDQRFDLGYLVTRQDGEVAFDRVQQTRSSAVRASVSVQAMFPHSHRNLPSPSASSFLIVSFTRLKNSSVRATRSSREETEQVFLQARV